MCCASGPPTLRLAKKGGLGSTDGKATHDLFVEHVRVEARGGIHAGRRQA